ncbi:MAG: hypothetical protein LIO71_06715 [Ruminococcus sp.]|nr:hypothetical protein [Ruminococcus sp.]
MARNRVTIDFKGFDDYMEKMDKLGGTDLMKKGVEAGLKASKQYVNQEIKKAMVKSNLPAKGQYSHGDTEKSIDKDFNINWEGTLGYTNIGFRFDKVGLLSIYLMYGTKSVHGTPRMAPVEGLYDAIYGKKTKSKMRKLQKEAINKVIERYMK